MSKDEQQRDGGESDRTLAKLLEPENWRRYTRYPFLVAKFIFWGGLFAALYACLSAIGNVLFPVFVSLLIAYLFDPVVDWFEERDVSRSLGILCLLFGGLLLTAGFVMFLYPTFVAQIDRVIKRAPELMEVIRTRAIPWVEQTFEYEVPATVSAWTQEYGQTLSEYLPDLANRAGQWATGLVTGTGAVVGALIHLVMIPVFSFYFLRDFDRIRLKIGEFIPQHRRKFVLDRLSEMDDVVGQWVRGQLQVAGILAIMYAVGLSVSFAAAGIDAQSGVAIGLLSGILNFIPYFGVIIGLILSVLIVLINWSGFLPLLGVLLVFVVVQMFEGYLITPKIVGDKVGLSPVTVIIVLLIGGELFGLIGFLLAIPLFGAFKVLFPDIVAWYKQTAFYRGRKMVPSGEVDADRVARARRAQKRRERASDQQEQADRESTDESSSESGEASGEEGEEGETTEADDAEGAAESGDA